MQREIKLNDTNEILFIICLILGIINASLGNIAPTIFISAFMICCFVDKSGYERREN